ncbi:MAG: multiheme c-type cytochrome [Armatimonadota bacterium]|nr:multiheme c-type cytochrome [Armatimonadota bacterium]
MRSKWVVFGLPLAALLALGFYRPSALETHARPLAIVFSSEINGYITPCGCSKPMVGGIPRRGALLRQLAEQYTLLKLENGDLTKASGRQDELKAETLIEMLNQMGYDALNLGKYDFLLGMDYLRALQLQFKGAMLCANVQEGGKPAFDAYTLVEKSHNGHTVRALIVGLISERHAEAVRRRNPQLTITPALQKLNELRPQIEAQGDLRVLLFYGSEQEAEQIAQAHPYFHLIVYANAGDGPMPPKQVGQTRLVFAGNDAKFVGIAHLSESAPYMVARVEHTRLTEAFKDDEQILALKLAYLARVEAENLLALVPRRPTPNGSGFAGSRACMPCHAEDYRIWQRTAHAKAMQTLVNEKHDKDPECVVCHVVGLEYEGGFQSMDKTPQLKDVGCESCHGPAKLHAQDPEKHRLGKAGPQSCMTCHVPAHSPGFDFESYWKKIEHGFKSASGGR